MPYGDSASMMPFITAGSAPTHPASPAPLTPSGLIAVGTGLVSIQPGPNLMMTNLDLVWTLIWALVIANLMAVFMFLGVARWLGLLAFVRGGVLIPFVFVLAMLGSYLSQGHWQNLILILLLGVLGYGLKRFDWPRPPFVIVLGRARCCA